MALLWAQFETLWSSLIAQNLYIYETVFFFQMFLKTLFKSGDSSCLYSIRDYIWFKLTSTAGNTWKMSSFFKNGYKTQQRWNSIPFADDTSPRVCFPSAFIRTACPIIFTTHRAMCVTFCVPFWRVTHVDDVTVPRAWLYFDQSLHFSVKVIWSNWQHISISAAVVSFCGAFWNYRTCGTVVAPNMRKNWTERFVLSSKIFWKAISSSKRVERVDKALTTNSRLIIDADVFTAVYYIATPICLEMFQRKHVRLVLCRWMFNKINTEL